MKLRNFFLRVYIRIGSGFNLLAKDFKKLSLSTILEEVAKCNPNGDIEPLYDNKTGKVYEKRTKRFVVRKANKFIAGINDELSNNEDMADFASLKQLNLLIRAFDEEKKQISCFGLVFVYIMYSLLEGKSSAADECAKYVIVLYRLVFGYHIANPNDEVAAFFVGCFDPIIEAIEQKNPDLKVEHLPGRPCRHPKENKK